MRIAHISDLHFAKPTYSPSQFLSKRWVGNFNLLFFRKKDFLSSHLLPLPELFHAQKVETVIITGDFSTTSRCREFEAGAQFVKALREKGMEVILIPGNHDHYTKAAYRKKKFYDYFTFSSESQFSLKEDGITAKKIGERWWIVALDTALATPWLSSRGFFSPLIEEKLKNQLDFIPTNDHVILINHFPFFQHEGPRVRLNRGPELQAMIRAFPKIKLYLHGHTHRHTIADLRVDGLPIILDSGSTSHRTRGSWNLMEISPKGMQVDIFQWCEEWKRVRKEEFTW